MRPNILLWVGLLPLLLAACVHHPYRSDPELLGALAAVRGDDLRVVHGAEAVQAHLQAQAHLRETREQALQRWCTSAEAGASPWPSYCPAPDGELQIISVATPVMPADVVARHHEAGIDSGDWVVQVGDYVLVADRGSLTSLDVSGFALRVADRINYSPDAEGDSNSSARLLMQSGQLVLCSYSGRDLSSALIGLRLATGGRLQRLWGLEIAGWNLCTAEQDRAYLYPDALLVSFRVDANWAGQARYRSGDGPWQSLQLLDEVYLTGQVAPWPSLRVLLHCPLAELGASEPRCTLRTVVSDGNEVLYLGTDAAYVLLAEAKDSLYLDPWMVLGHYAFPLDLRPAAKSGGIETPYSASKRQTWVLRVPLRADSPILMTRLGGWQFHAFPAAEIDGDLAVLTRQQSPERRQSLALHRLGQSAVSGSTRRLQAPILRLSLAREACVDPWLGEAWAWFAIADRGCGEWVPNAGRTEAARLHGVDLRSGRRYRLPLAGPSGLIAPGGRLIAVSTARESLRLSLLELGHEPRPPTLRLAPVLELAGFGAIETIPAWEFGPAYANEAASGRMVLNLAVSRHGQPATENDDDPILDLLLLDVHDGRLRLLGATDLSHGSGWHPTHLASHGDARRLLLSHDRLLLVGPSELIELWTREGRLISGDRLRF